MSRDSNLRLAWLWTHQGPEVTVVVDMTVVLVVVADVTTTVIGVKVVVVETVEVTVTFFWQKGRNLQRAASPGLPLRATRPSYCGAALLGSAKDEQSKSQLSRPWAGDGRYAWYVSAPDGGGEPSDDESGDMHDQERGKRARRSLRRTKYPPANPLFNTQAIDPI